MFLNRRQSQNEEHQPLVRDSLSSDSEEHHELDDFDLDDPYKRVSFSSSSSPRSHRRSISLSHIIPWRSMNHKNWLGGPWKYIRLAKRAVFFFGIMVVLYILLTPIFFPSYLRRPAHYSGRNDRGEKVFIAANIVDEELIRGDWGRQIVELVELLGEENVWLSIYENDSGEGTKSALQELKQRVNCNSSIVSGHIDLNTFPSIQILPDEHRIKRIAYLSEVRNRAIEPLTSGSTGMHFDKLLFINDVIFSPKDAADLLFATNIGPDGKTQYHAACAMDFINAFKFYDTFASRDAEGYGIGVPFFPWFSSAGRALSRRDVIYNSDHVRVKSCWGGMVAFEAKWFQGQPSPPFPSSLEDAPEQRPPQKKREEQQENEMAIEPLSFRASPELFWESSECCLIHADLSALSSSSPEPYEDYANEDTGIYMNPYIRVAYTMGSFKWLEFARRFERLYTVPQRVVNWVAGRPPFQPRRTAKPGEVVEHREWKYDGPGAAAPEDADDGVWEKRDKKKDKAELMLDIQQNGHWETVERKAAPGGFCGGRQLLVLKKEWAPGQRIWEKIGPPPGAMDK